MTILRLAAFAALGSVCALQIPLVHNSAQQTLVGHSHKPLVDSEALQAAIKVENLLARAEDLYKIAKLGEDEYNHPTRVIGSAGASFYA
jgi:aminopeptidase Y